VNDVEARLALYRAFVESGRAPSATQLASILRTPEADARACLDRLAAARIIVLQPESREILFAPPLSAIPTPFLAHVNGRSHFAPCAWDALGAVAMLGGVGEVETSCACCGEAMRIVVHAGEPEGQGIVHFAVPAREWWSDLVFT
jgi:hypothetical protein